MIKTDYREFSLIFLAIVIDKGSREETDFYWTEKELEQNTTQYLDSNLLLTRAPHIEPLSHGSDE